MNSQMSLELFKIADEKKWTWFETYQVAKATAVSQVISVKRIREKIAQKPVTSDFSPKEATIIREAKKRQPCSSLLRLSRLAREVLPRLNGTCSSRWQPWACWMK